MHRNGPFDEQQIARIGSDAARLAWEGGMTVLRPEGEVVPIPLVAEPEVETRERLAWLAAESRAILSASVKLARALLARGEPRDREALLGPFEGLEAEALSVLFTEAPCPAVVSRVDFLPPGDGGLPRALELNATIPAMPAYADLATHSWIRAAARIRGLPPHRERDLVARAGSHMEALRETLVAFYRWRGGAHERPSIAIVARPGDAQIGNFAGSRPTSGRWGTRSRCSCPTRPTRTGTTSSTGTSGRTGRRRPPPSRGRCASRRGGRSPIR